MAKASTKTSKYIRTAAQLLGVAALGWACRKAASIPAGRLQDLRNRLLLSWNFFQATQVTGTIHRAEFGFIYLDGDRSAHVKQVAGLWTHEADQPDLLCLVPRYWPMASGGQWMPYDSVVRRAMILARSDRGRDVAKRTRTQIAEVLSYEWRLEPGKADSTIGEPGWEDRAEEAYARAYARYPMWPRFYLEAGLPAGRERVGSPADAASSSASDNDQLLGEDAQVRNRAAFDDAAWALERLVVAMRVLHSLSGSEPRRPSDVAVPSLDELPVAAAGELPIAER